MLQKSNLIPRQSGKKLGYYYIDYLGHYKISEISKIVDVESSKIKSIYVENEGEYSEEFDVYYFDSLDKANKVIDEISRSFKVNKTGKLLLLTEKEIEYIRKALINDGVNNISISDKVKDSLFKKLNS